MVMPSTDDKKGYSAGVHEWIEDKGIAMVTVGYLQGFPPSHIAMAA